MNAVKKSGKIPGSFRDQSGFLFYRDGEIYRQINKSYKDNYDQLMTSGLYDDLVGAKLLIPHDEADSSLARSDSCYKVIKPELIKFISYPYEWCFSQLKAAALATLEIQKRALSFDMSLKDSNCYNIQFRDDKPVFIDTLSFERHKEGHPWVAYRQFCQHFLAPLALMSYSHICLNQLLKVYIDGIPLDLASRLLPLRTRLKVSLLSHIHLHAKSQNYFSGKKINMSNPNMSRMSLLGIIDNLETSVRNMTWKPKGTEWADYYEDTNYTDNAFIHKKSLITEFVEHLSPETVWDLGANIGTFSRITSEKCIHTVSFDIDPAAVEKNFIECTRRNETHILPLVLDLTNPSPAIGWDHSERMSFIERGPVDTVIALALIHHLAISNNLPLSRIAKFLSRLCRSLIIEFIPKSDSQVQRLLSSREDIFPDYTREYFEEEFNHFFKIENAQQINGSERRLYLMKRK